MCIIVGALSKTGQNISSTLSGMLRAITNEFPYVNKIALNLQGEYVEFDSVEKLNELSLSASTMALGSICSSMNEKQCMAVRDPRSTSAAISGKIFSLPEAPASLIQLFEGILSVSGNIKSSAKRLVEQLDGQFAFVLRWGDTILLARDVVGVKPLYLAENDRLIAFSTRRRPLWSQGLTNCTNIARPTLISKGEIATISAGMSLESLKEEEGSLVEALAILLSTSVKKMAAQHSKIAILFSGGLDSSIIAKLSKDLDINCTLYCAGSSLSRDLANARRMSSALDIPLVETEITIDDVASHLLPVVGLIESTEMIAVSTSIPIYFAVRESACRGERLALHGQGADELFGGYERYENTLLTEGYNALCNEMLNDVVGLGNVIPLYDPIGTMNSVQLLAPFLDATVVKYSLGISPQLKLVKDDLEISRKYILSQVASRIGVPMQHLPKQKVAAQFGSGVARILDKISRGAGFTKRRAKASGFPLPVQAYLREVRDSAGFPS